MERKVKDRNEQMKKTKKGLNKRVILKEKKLG